MTELYPEIEPYAQGMLDVGDGNRVHWATSGNPAGKVALVVHGGPGSGSNPRMRRYFDPARYRIIQFDQRGCGASTPHASDPATDMSHNTTAHLIADMERLREHLGVGQWLVYGGSWGSTLTLAYAEQHPDRVTEIVLFAVTMTRRSEIDWLYRGAGRFFPREWERFWAGAGGIPRDDDIVAAYARLIEHPNAAVRERAVADWCAWEDAVVSAEAQGTSSPYGGRPPRAKVALVRICSRYFAHGAWLEEGVLLREAHLLGGIPGVLIHGRNDLGGGAYTPWELARGWPGAELIIVGDSGHTGSASMTDEADAAAERLYRRIMSPA